MISTKLRKGIEFVLSIPSAYQHFKKYPPTFIIGAARSGTTLTLKLFENQPQITTLFEPCQFWETAFRGGEDDTYETRLNWVGFQILRYLYYHKITPENPYLVIKDPRDSIRVSTLNHLFPNAKFIHIIRDGRDVIASMIKTHNKDFYYLNTKEEWPHVRIPNYRSFLDVSPHIKAAIQWKYCVETSLKDLSLIPENRQLTFHYEDLIAYPQDIAIQLLKFANPKITINQSLLQDVIDSISNEVMKNQQSPTTFNPQKRLSWEEKRSQFSSLVINDAGSGTTADRIRSGRWKEELDKNILSDINSMIKDLLSKLGYE